MSLAFSKSLLLPRDCCKLVTIDLAARYNRRQKHNNKQQQQQQLQLQ